MLPVTFKEKNTDTGFIRMFVNAFVVEAENVPLLCGQDTLKEWKALMDLGRDTITIHLGKPIEFDCNTTEGGHKVVKLYKSGEWTTEETVYFMSNDDNDEMNFKKIKRIHDVTNHKSEAQLLFAFRKANKLNEMVRKLIKRVVDNCKVCQKFKRSQGRPKVSLPKVTDFNQIGTLELNKYVL